MWAASNSVLDYTRTTRGKDIWMREHFTEQNIPEDKIDSLVQVNRQTSSAHIGYGGWLFSGWSESPHAFVSSLNTGRASTCTSNECEGCSLADVGYCRERTSISIDQTIKSFLEARNQSVAETGAVE